MLALCLLGGQKKKKNKEKKQQRVREEESKARQKSKSHHFINPLHSEHRVLFWSVPKINTA